MENKIEESENLEQMAKDMLNTPLPKGSHTRCPLTNQICSGRMCALWLDASKSEINLIPRMCLFRLALKQISIGD